MEKKKKYFRPTYSKFVVKIAVLDC